MEIFPRFDVIARLLGYTCEILPQYDVIALLLGYSWCHFLGIRWSKSVRHLVQVSLGFDNLIKTCTHCLTYTQTMHSSLKVLWTLTTCLKF